MPQDRELENSTTYRQNLLSIANKNRSNGYQIYLWTDSASIDAFSKEGVPNLHIINFDERSNERVDKLTEISGHEKLIEKINTFRGPYYDNNEGTEYNFGVASDILRAMILFSFGGIYIDAYSKFLAPLPHQLELSKTVSLGGKGEHSKHGFGDLSNDIIAVTQRGAAELGLYLRLINEYMSEDYIDLMLIDYEDPGNSDDKIAEQYTKRFGPKLMRVCILRDALTHKSYEAYFKSHHKEPKDTLEDIFFRSIDKFDIHMSVRGDNLNVYTEYLFSMSYFMRGQANSWRKKGAIRVISPKGDSTETTYSSFFTSAEDGSSGGSGVAEERSSSSDGQSEESWRFHGDGLEKGELDMDIKKHYVHDNLIDKIIVVDQKRVDSEHKINNSESFTDLTKLETGYHADTDHVSEDSDQDSRDSKEESDDNDSVMP